ncbi:PREDICTED: mitochondrial ornithine transporter 1 [Ceratosolen solmsi marchali]|uniref:Mitochondrial ornithine transporter 1 n=1 Tax=Ceratosolen solmsi marchali TaxID=326594 RepID=A0AAJ7DW16_9HYME|nr:PREDICTED: mitochondrial ornithine transporter 1 [Ceratosolen solmsi marchali]
MNTSSENITTIKSKNMSNMKDGLIDFIAGSVGGVALVYVGQPLDTVKVKMQTFPKIYVGMVDCFMKTVRTDGIVKGLYAGTLPSIVANVAENSILFAAYGGCQKIVANIFGVPKVENLSSFENALAGFCAAFFSTLTLCPTELIKCRLQAMREVQSYNKTGGTNVKYVGPWKLTRQIIKESGISGLYRGLTSTIVREMPGYFFFFGAYELTRELLAKPEQNRDEIGWQRTMVAGAVGGTVLWIVIFPADVVKSRIQAQNLKTPAMALMKDIVKTEGVSALYSGLKPTLIRTIPATATLFVTYEYTKKLMHRIVD